MEYKKVDIKKECANFCESMGSENWSESQINSMSAAFYAGAMVSFNALANASLTDDDEEIAVQRMDTLHKDIIKNISAETATMKKIWVKAAH